MLYLSPFRIRMDLVLAIVSLPRSPPSSLLETIYLRVDYKKGKGKFPFHSNPLLGCESTKDMSPKDFFQRKGMLFLTTKNVKAFLWAMDHYKSLANKHVGETLQDRCEHIIYVMEEKDTHICYENMYEILFRPSGVESSEASWIQYRIDTGEYTNSLPSGSWDVTYVMCCGGETLQQGAPTAFVMYNLTSQTR